jgi:hypothetical protein
MKQERLRQVGMIHETNTPYRTYRTYRTYMTYKIDKPVARAERLRQDYANQVSLSHFVDLIRMPKGSRGTGPPAGQAAATLSSSW